MADSSKKAFILSSMSMTHRFAARGERIQERLTDYRHGIIYILVSLLQASVNLQKQFQEGYSEYEFEVVSVSKEIGETFDYSRRKSSAGGNVLVSIHLEVETKDRSSRLTSKNDRSLEEDFPCEVLFDIREAGDTSDETVAERFQPFAITKERVKIINGWLAEYQEALRNIIVVCKDKNTTCGTVHRMIKHHLTGEFFMNVLSNRATKLSMKLPQKRNIAKFQHVLTRRLQEEIIRKFTQTIREKMLQTMDRMICDRLNTFVSSEKCGCESYGSIFKIIEKGLPNWVRRGTHENIKAIFSISIFKKDDEKNKPTLSWSIHKLHRFITNALEEHNQIIEKEKLPVPDILENRRKLKSVRCGLVDSTRTESVYQTPTTLHQTTDSAPDSKAVKTATQETRYVDEYIRNNSLKLLPEEKRRLYELVNKHSEELMEKHSNLNSIGISPVLSRKKGFEKKLCIVMYCSGKGNIPQREGEFPKDIKETPVDVREGKSSLFSIPGAQEYNDPLRIGISIGGKGINASGTLGPFVVEPENETSMGFLTCQHVFSSAEVGSQVVQPSVKVNEADTDIENKICGKIQSMSTEEITYNKKPTGVDVAYVVINQRIPKELKLPEMLINDFGGILRMGQPIMDMKSNTKVYKLGLTTGLTVGCFETIMTMVKVDQKTYQNVYLVSSDTEFASHGDSGSAVFTVNDNTIHVVGLLFGGTDNKKECYVVPIGAALQSVGPRLEIHQFNNETGSDVPDSGVDSSNDNASSSLGVGAEAGCPNDKDIPVISKTVTKFAISK